VFTVRSHTVASPSAAAVHAVRFRFRSRVAAASTWLMAATSAVAVTARDTYTEGESA